MNVNVWPDLFRQVLSVSSDKCLMEHTYSAKHEIAGCMRLCGVDYIIFISGLANQVIKWVLPIVTMMYGIIEM